ncbi:MAG TPA: hypothetical protein VGG45_04980 [Terracidiphilus sp.]|jgi:hypothetical protein
MHNQLLFIGDVLAHWVAFMSSIVSFTLSIVEYMRERKMEGWIFAVIASVFLLVACEAAWQDEHRNATVLAAEKSLAVQGENFWKDQSYQKDTSLRIRDEMLNKNYSALIAEQQTTSETQTSLAQLSGKILEIGKPVSFQWRALALEKPDPISGTSNSKERWLLLSNKPVSPVEFQFSCSRQIIDAETKVAGSDYEEDTVQLNEPGLWGSHISSPAWGPDAPILIEMTISEGGSEFNSCKFRLITVVK